MSAFESLKQSFPWPANAHENRHMRETYTGRGKGIVVELVIERKLSTMLEVGSFLGSSIDFWLNACPGLQIVSVDPLGGGWAGTHCKKLRYNQHCLLDLTEENIAYLDSEEGLYKTFLKNMNSYRDQLVLIRSTAADAIKQLQESRFSPDVIYLDADKSYQNLEMLFGAFPDAIISGDDYRWKNAEGIEVMKKNVNDFAQAHNLCVVSHFDTWLLRRP